MPPAQLAAKVEREKKLKAVLSEFNVSHLPHSWNSLFTSIRINTQQTRLGQQRHGARQ
jgi:hypothetical protein